MPDNALVSRDDSYTDEMKARDQISTNVFGDLIVDELAQLNETEYYNKKYNKVTKTTEVKPV